MPSHADGNRFFINEFDESIDAFMLDLISLTQEPCDLEFWINSEGGDAKRAFALVELISLAKQRGATVRTVVLSDASSAGAMVAVAGTPGHRLVAPSGIYLLHYGEAKHGATSLREAKQIGEANVAHFKKVIGHFKDHCNIPKLSSQMEADFYVNAEQAIKWNMADGYLK